MSLKKIFMEPPYEELDRVEVEMWLVWNSTDPQLDDLLTNMEDDGRADYISDECHEWMEKRVDELLKDYKKFIDSKLKEDAEK